MTRSVRVFVIIYIFAGGLRGCPEAGAVKVRAKKLAKLKPLSIGPPSLFTSQRCDLGVAEPIADRGVRQARKQVSMVNAGPTSPDLKLGLKFNLYRDLASEIATRRAP